ncbi:rRNA biogenesis protein RRP5 [Malania oleifera]|uniref:rRNA biogenesis protein RRP5 n=1 Tax=Malania oleifera TaxID=397392 RepID=UPI0025ADA0E7|nr:rRNA biogenesis protein RRP5 [Malania oleifera]
MAQAQAQAQAQPSKKSSRKKPNLHKISKKSFKLKKKPDNAVQSKMGALQVEDDDLPDFPRGGGASLSRREKDEIHAEVDAEFEAQERVLKKKQKKKVMQKKTQAAEDDLGSLFGDGLTGKLPKFANKITLKNISPGMKLWGVIAEVNEKDLVVSLPGGLRGLVRASEAFDPLNNEAKVDVDGNFLPSIFHVGQLVSCVVLQLDDDKKEKGKRKVWLSLRLSLLYKGFTLDALQEGMVVSAYVKSIEDHGYILHFGLPSFTGFCPKDSHDETREIKVKTGQLLQGLVRNIDKARKVVHLSSDHDMLSKCVTKDLKGISIDLLIPGMMVNARVRCTLENGIMLSFLTYFTGTVDIFHLQNTFPTANWKDDYHQNKKVNARILFVDPSTRAIGLTLNPDLVHNHAPPSQVKLGDICDHSKVVRVDGGLGLLLKIPTCPVSTPAYVTISDVADGEVRKLEKIFKEGIDVRVRILGFRHLEGLAMGVLKASAFEGSMITHSDVKPGLVVKAKVIAVDSFGAIVKFPSGVKALCPLPHMSELEIVKPGKKFKVGAELEFRVLGCKSKRVTVTHKKTLVKSKLEILSSYADANECLVTHGWIAKIEKHGCFVRFYNGVQGFAPRSELGLDPGCETSSTYHVGQVVKCRVTSSIPASRRINLSFIIKPSSISKDDTVKLGNLVSGVVEQVIPHAIIVLVEGKDYLKGTISTEHLADNHGLATLMMSALKPGYEFVQLLVLDVEGNNLILSAKHSLIKSAQQLPLDLSQIRQHSIVHGYICNIIHTGCFVRYLGRLTGFCPRNKAMDDKRADLSEAYYVGQSVRSNILDVNNQTGRITVSLKQSSCSSTDASFIQEYFILEEKIAKLQFSDSRVAELKWVEGFDIGSVIEGKVHEVKDFGVVISFEKYSDIFGFITHYQLCGNSLGIDSTVRAAILDVAKAERLVDLSLKPAFIERFEGGGSNSQTHKKKRKREVNKDLEAQQTVNAIVEIVKENYLVLSLPEHNQMIGYAAVSDYNTQKFPQKQFLIGQSVIATVISLPSPLTGGRLLLLLKSISESTDTSSSKRAKKKLSYNVGSLIQAEITEKKPFELGLKFGIGFHGRVHITEVCDDNTVEDPLSVFRIGQTVTARIVAKTNQIENNRKRYGWELSMKPTILAGSDEFGDNLMGEDFDFSTGQRVTGYVYKVDSEWVWLTVSRYVKAQLFILDSACEPSELKEFQKRFNVGKVVSGYVLCSNKAKRLLQIILRPLFVASNGTLAGKIHSSDDSCSDNSKENIVTHINEGDVVGGRISKILPGVGGLLVQIGPHLYGKIHFTELTDLWVSEPLSGYYEGQFVKCHVLEINHTVKGTVHIDLSLRSSLNGIHSSKSIEANGNMLSTGKRVDKVEDLHSNMVVQGYVKNVSSKGCFILLSRRLDAKILISNLSDNYVENLEEEFPVGKLVVGRVLSVEPLSKRVEVTLKSNASNASKSELNDLSSLHVGDTISGMIRRVESYGLFIRIDHTNLVGLCHVSELSDDPIDNIESKYRAGERVAAKILKVDEERHRISLGMKNSYIGDDTDTKTTSKQSPYTTIKENGFINDIQMLPQSSLPVIQNVATECENGESLFLAQAEARASILPLEVVLDDIEHPDMDILASQNQEHLNEAAMRDEKDTRKAKKKAKAEREREIRAAEERLLEEDVPRTADEFEKLVRRSPNSSFAWIKYMEFVLSLADVEKARSIAERALRTINIREESEKLNIWVAYLNLENEYGSPPEEAVIKIFQRAMQFCDPEKVHIALLGIYERTGQDKLADELLNKMTKKFKRSCTVWLRRIQRNLNQHLDGVQSIVNRALLSLPRHEHIQFISQTAILEFKCGDPERGRSMFEGMLREYPKRTDLWSIYLDQEIRLGDMDIIRSLFERAISLTLAPKKMEFLFKKYLEYEKSIGDEDRIESVKRKAMDYIASQTVDAS